MTASHTPLGLVIVGACVLTAAFLQAQAEGQSVRRGPYSEQQSTRGQSLYGEHCAPCHGADLSGTQIAPLLVGEDFIKGWNDRTVGELFDRLRLTMPEDNPGKLTPLEYADLTAFLLNSNGAHASPAELDPNGEAQKAIRISETR